MRSRNPQAIAALQGYADIGSISSATADQQIRDLQRTVAEATRQSASMASSYTKSFDEIGDGWKEAAAGLVAGSLSWQKAGVLATREVAKGFLSLAQSVASSALAGPLAGLLGLASPAAGATVGSVLGGWFSGLLAFRQGGIVPSAAGGWALPSFAGARPAMLHSREMVLPASISEGLQGMIASGGGVAASHLHLHSDIMDGPSIDRWYKGVVTRNPGAIRDLMRSNALTPRTI
jgi:hypothetical protein